MRVLMLQGLVCLLLAVSLSSASPKAPKTTIIFKVEPRYSFININMNIRPIKATLTLKNITEEYWCSDVIIAWGDETESEASMDCEPFEKATEDQKKLFRFFRSHSYNSGEPGTYEIVALIKKNGKIVARKSETIKFLSPLNDP